MESAWRVMCGCRFNTSLEIKLVGKVDISVIKSIEENNLESNFRKIDYLPHDEVIKEQQRSQVLLLLINNAPNAKGILTGKVFEYLAAHRPVLCIGVEDGDAANILNQTNAGVTVNYSDSERLKKTILGFYADYKNRTLKVNSKNTESYSRKNLTMKLSEILNEVSS